MNDLLEECITDLDHKGKDYPAFQATFCVRCRNAECIHAKRAEDTFSRRVKTQVDRLFNPQVTTNNREPKYAMIEDFIDLRQVAEQIEVNTTRPDPRKPPKPKRAPKKSHEEWHADYLDKKLGSQDAPLEAPEDTETEPVIQEPLAPPQHAPSIIRPGNTQVPKGGILLPGDPNSVAVVSKKIHPAAAAWGVTPEDPSGTKIVERGASIKMGGGK